MIHMFREADNVDFDLSRFVIAFLSANPFFAELSRHIRKVPTRDMPTCAVAFDMKADEITLFWNPDFMKKMDEAHVYGILLHEYYHLVFGHVASRRKKPAQMWNVATDLAINSLICGGDIDSNALPKFTLMPGRFPSPPEERALSKEEKAAMPIASLIEKMPQMAASEWYFSKLMETAQKSKCPACGRSLFGDPSGSGDEEGEERQSQGSGGEDCKGDHGHEDHDHQPGEGKKNCPVCQNGEGWIGSWDDHDPWDGIPEDQREYIEGRIKNVIHKAVNHADQQSNGWGNIPAEVRDDIRRSVSNIINWRAVLKQFIGQLVRGARRTSIKHINRKYPYIHPGATRGYVAKLLVCIDQSGSVGDQMLEMFFSELGSLTRKVTIDVLPFDCVADSKDIFTWRRGQKPALKRVKSGGTNFDAPNGIVNDPQNRGRWDGVLVMTDGQAPQPSNSRIKRAWVLGKGTKLEFNSNELQIFLDEKPALNGAWR